MHVRFRDMRCVGSRRHRPRKPLWSWRRPLEETMKSMVTLVAQQGTDPFQLIVSLWLIVSSWSNYGSLSRCRLMGLLEGLWFRKVHEWWRKLIGWSLVIYRFFILCFHAPLWSSPASSQQCQPNFCSSIIFSIKVFNLLFPSHLHFIWIMKAINHSLWPTFPSNTF